MIAVGKIEKLKDLKILKDKGLNQSLQQTQAAILPVQPNTKDTIVWRYAMVINREKNVRKCKQVDKLNKLHTSH
jgi:hypothetical protein